MRGRTIDPQIFTLYASLFIVLGNLFALASLIISYRNPQDRARTLISTEVI